MTSPLRVLRAFRHVGRAGELLRCVRESPDWAVLIPGYLGLQRVRYPFTFHTRAGEALTLQSFHDLVTAWIVFFRPEYRVEPSMRTIIDAGANIGAFSLYAARHAPTARIIALEPFPETAEQLERHVRENGVADRVHCRRWALGQEDGERRMDASSGPSQSRGLLANDTGGAGIGVATLTLASLLEREGLERVDLLKMDIEGAEHEVLPGTPHAVLRRIDRLALEYHPNGSKERLFEALRRAGFVCEHDDAVAPGSGVAYFRQPHVAPGR